MGEWRAYAVHRGPPPPQLLTPSVCPHSAFNVGAADPEAAVSPVPSPSSRRALAFKGRRVMGSLGGFSVRWASGSSCCAAMPVVVPA